MDELEEYIMELDKHEHFGRAGRSDTYLGELVELNQSDTYISELDELNTRVSWTDAILDELITQVSWTDTILDELSRTETHLDKLS